MSPTANYRCEKCGEGYPTSRSLRRHRREPHTEFSMVFFGRDPPERFSVDPFYAGIDYTKRVELQYELSDIVDENDDGVSLDQALAYYEEPPKPCGCIRCCDNENCCGGAGGGGACRRGCRCYRNFDPDSDEYEYEYESDEDEDMDMEDFDDVSPELRNKYEQQYRMEEGFDLEYMDYCIKKYGLIILNALPTPLPPLSRFSSLKDQDRIKKFAVLAIKRYNLMNPGKNYRCLQFLEGNVQYGGEDKYFITFIAADYAASGDYVLEPPKTFQAKVGVSIEGEGRTYVTRVLFCRLKSQAGEVDPGI